MKSCSHMQQRLLESVYIMDWSLVDLLLHHAPHFIIDHGYSNLDCLEAIMC